MTVNVGDRFILGLLDKIKQCESRRNWSALPDSFRADALKALKTELLTYLRGKASNVQAARRSVAGAASFAECRSALARLEFHPERKCEFCGETDSEDNTVGNVSVAGLDPADKITVCDNCYLPQRSY